MKLSELFDESFPAPYNESALLAALFKNLGTIAETSSAGGTSAGNMATSAGGLGAGFDPSKDHGIYQKKSKKSAIIRR